MDLKNKKCVPCEGGDPALTDEKEDELMAKITDWELDRTSVRDGKVSPHRLIRKYKFADFREAMTFVNKVADIANEEDHHPNIFISYSRVTLEFFTHAVGGLSENDFIMAAKINTLNHES